MRKLPPRTSEPVLLFVIINDGRQECNYYFVEIAHFLKIIAKKHRRKRCFLHKSVAVTTLFLYEK